MCAPRGQVSTIKHMKNEHTNAKYVHGTTDFEHGRPYLQWIQQVFTNIWPCLWSGHYVGTKLNCANVVAGKPPITKMWATLSSRIAIWDQEHHLYVDLVQDTFVDLCRSISIYNDLCRFMLICDELCWLMAISLSLYMYIYTYIYIYVCWFGILC